VEEADSRTIEEMLVGLHIAIDDLGMGWPEWE
jgi:hypothetical protein